LARADFEKWGRALRLHQWAKNTLIFVPLIVSHQITNTEKMRATVVAFVAFGLTASATYIWNDLSDLDSDRRHPTKRNRPFASGQISVVNGVWVSILLITFSFATSVLLLPIRFASALLVYILITVIYSLYLKKKLMVDVIVLGALFALRVFIGAIAAEVVISPWLLAFSLFFFLSLAFVKRYSDLSTMSPEATEKLGGRGYFAQDLDLVRVMGPLAGYMAVMVMALYVNSPNVLELYSAPEWLWMVCVCLLYWISRVWFLAHRGHMSDDPVLFALKDRVSQLVGLATLAFVLLATVL
jgi:4-hydroxybenzoate polyprenyltransferase